MNVNSSEIVPTTKLPLYPKLKSPPVLVVSVRFLIMILSPTVRLCGNSVLIVTVVLDLVALAMYPRFLLKSTSEAARDVLLKSVSLLTPVVLDC